MTHFQVPRQSLSLGDPCTKQKGHFTSPNLSNLQKPFTRSRNLIEFLRTISRRRLNEQFFEALIKN